MATIKKTRESQYREILSQKGLRLEDCRVLAFTFPSEREAVHFHFAGMRLNYYIFDGVGETVTIVADPGAVDALTALALKCGGQRRTPSLR